MPTRFSYMLVWLLAAFTLGALLGRRWIGNEAEALLNGALALAALFVAGSAAIFLRERISLKQSLPLSVQKKPERGWLLFALSLAIYAFTRLYALEKFPIYFFTDEAVHPVYGVELIRNGLRDAAHNLLPTYFQNGQYWNLSLSVYLHALTAELFGKTIFVTRATSAAVSILGVAATGLILKWIFNLRLWWVAVLFLAITPAWFLHSRTAFETVLMVSFYACFLLCYLLYRHRSPKFLFPALIFGAATFYAYSNGQAVMAVSGILFLFSDLRYHLKHWRTGLLGVGVLILLALPYVRFRLIYPDAATSQLYLLNSYWLQPIPFPNKLARFAATYAYGLSPQYWFSPDVPELARHLMKGYGNIEWWVAPFALIGLAICLYNWKSSAYRSILIAALAAPFGSALAEIGITRVLMFVIPVSVFATLGLDALVGQLKSARWQRATATVAFGFLALASLAMLRDALINGPRWYPDYGLYGMQWGAKQIYVDAVPPRLQREPTATVYVSHTWANGANIFLRFFDLDRGRVQIESILGFMDRRLPLPSEAIFIMTREEYAVARTNLKFKPFAAEQTIRYPDGSDGFYIARVAYADNADALFAAERAAQREPVSEPFVLNGETVQITHTKFDIGTLAQIFDSDSYSVARGVEANPLTVEIVFPTPRALQSLTGIFGRVRFKLKAQLFAPGSPEPVDYEKTFDFATSVPGQFSGPPATLTFDRGSTKVSKMRLEVTYVDGGDSAHVHIFEMSLQ